MELSPRFIEGLIYGSGSQRRLTQDSPVLPDVWTYLATPSKESERSGSLRGGTAKSPTTSKKGSTTLELLLTPHRDVGPAVLARQLRKRLAQLRKKKKARQKIPARIAYTQSYVVARLSFEELVIVLLPLTPWWRSYVWRDLFTDLDEDEQDDRLLSGLLASFERRHLVSLLEAWHRTRTPESYSRETLHEETLWAAPAARMFSPEGEECGDETLDVPADLLWMLNIVGSIEWARRLTKRAAKEQHVRFDDDLVSSPPYETAERAKIDFRPIVDAACDLLDIDLPVLQARQPSLWLINRNRPAAPALFDSRAATKADAATRLFDIHCHEIAWAVIDSGVDASHPAFLKDRRQSDSATPETATPRALAAPWQKRTRIEKTYDFTRLRPLLDQEVARELLNAPNILEQRFGDDELDSRLEPIRRLIKREDEVEEVRKKAGATRWEPSRRRLRTQLEELKKRIEQGREIDWELLDPLLEVPHDESYQVPISGHGTHVAGILGADWTEKQLIGMCPDIRIYDLRVLDPFGPNDEFTVLAALQFIQYLNLQKEILTLHGANLSLSIRHDVNNYACGRTPVCDECERLVSSGVVVVAAGGNAGWDEDLARAGAGAGYRTVSITDPGNAEAVITVGATHRSSPHTYGVSFFSSRGPTGDGRAKPDLVAPGEKITSTIPGGRSKRQDGTSMAAPHVSGAAALLMARYQELIGHPRRIKEILCLTATDLGREKSFQGAGMLDVLRALQSV